MRTLSLVALVATLHGCKSSHEPKAPDCAAAVGAMLKVKDSDSERMAAFTKRCTEDAWSQEARKCYVDAKTTDESARCYGELLTDAQREKLHQELQRSLRDPTPAEMEERLAKMEELVTEMCACKDTVCAKRVSDEMTRWISAISKSGTRTPKLTGKQEERVMRIGKEMASCMEKAMTTGGPAAAPTDAQRYVAKNAEFKERICACNDAACGDTIAAEMTRWSEDFLAHPSDQSTMDVDGQARMETIEKEVHACLRALRKARK